MDPHHLSRDVGVILEGEVLFRQGNTAGRENTEQTQMNLRSECECLNKKVS